MRDVTFCVMEERLNHLSTPLTFIELLRTLRNDEKSLPSFECCFSFDGRRVIVFHSSDRQFSIVFILNVDHRLVKLGKKKKEIKSVNLSMG